MKAALGDRVAYCDMANPRATGTVTAIATACLITYRRAGYDTSGMEEWGVRPGYLEYEVTWDDADDGIPTSWSDLRQRGWTPA